MIRTGLAFPLYVFAQHHTKHNLTISLYETNPVGAYNPHLFRIKVRKPNQPNRRAVLRSLANFLTWPSAEHKFISRRSTFDISRFGTRHDGVSKSPIKQILFWKNPQRLAFAHEANS